MDRFSSRVFALASFALIVCLSGAATASAQGCVLGGIFQQGVCNSTVFQEAEDNLIVTQGSATVEVYVLDGGGESPLSIEAKIKLLPYVPVTTRNINRYEFVAKKGKGSISAVDGGEYMLEVSAPGYQTHRERLTVLPGWNEVSKAFVKMHVFDGSEDEIELEQPGAPVLLPAARRDLEMAVVELRGAKPERATPHIKSAMKHAPDNPDVHFIAGYAADVRKDYPAARKEYEAAVKAFPEHLASQIALGEELLQAADPVDAVPHLEKALTVGPNSWRAHWLLAEAYLQTTRDVEKAKLHATRAIELNKTKGVCAYVTIAIADAVAGNLKDSRTELEKFIHDFPKDKDVVRAQAFLKTVETAETESSAKIAIVPTPTGRSSGLDDLESISPEAMPGLPPAVDAAVPVVTEGIACTLPQVLTGAAMRSRELADNLERFSAKELVVNEDLDAKGTSKRSINHRFGYVAIIEHPRPDMIVMDELRDGSYGVTNFDASLLMEGIPAVGFIFNATFVSDFNFSCEGLGQWRGQPAWQVRFEQRTDRPARIHDWTINQKTYHTMIKGRAWITADSYQLLHVETDLAEPITPIKLEYQHMSIDYKPVTFPNRKTALWLPSMAQIYCKYRGHFFRQEHDFTDFTLFSVGTNENIGTSPRKKKQ